MYGVFVYHSGSNRDFKMLFFLGEGRNEVRRKKLSEQRRELTTNSFV